MNNKTDINVQYVSPLKKICMTIGELPSSYLETMSYYEMLVWFTEFLKNQVIPTVNNNAEAVQELQSLYEELRTYVNDYFDNLDVQEEINNKLDDMAESGQLTDIIAQYLGLAGMIAFDTVADMKEAQNLVNGSKCCTLGYRTVNDGGNAIYKIRTITNDDVIDDVSIIEMYDNSLIAELIIEDETVNIAQFGVIGDGETDDSDKIQIALNKAKVINFENKSYYMGTGLIFNDHIINGNNAKFIYDDDTVGRVIDDIGHLNHIHEIQKSLILKNCNFEYTITDDSSRFINNQGMFFNKATDNLIVENCNFKLTTSNDDGIKMTLFWTNALFTSINNCSIDWCSNSSAGTGGVFWTNTKDATKNYYVTNCNIIHQSVDETFAFWTLDDANTNSGLLNAFVSNCYVYRKEDTHSTNEEKVFAIYDLNDKKKLINAVFDNCVFESNSYSTKGLRLFTASFTTTLTEFSSLKLANCKINFPSTYGSSFSQLIGVKNCHVELNNNEIIQGNPGPFIRFTDSSDYSKTKCIIKNCNINLTHSSVSTFTGHQGGGYFEFTNNIVKSAGTYILFAKSSTADYDSLITDNSFNKNTQFNSAGKVYTAKTYILRNSFSQSVTVYANANESLWFNYNHFDKSTDNLLIGVVDKCDCLFNDLVLKNKTTYQVVTALSEIANTSGSVCNFNKTSGALQIVTS